MRINTWMAEFLNVKFFARADLYLQILLKVLTNQFCNKSSKIVNLMLWGGTKGHFVTYSSLIAPTLCKHTKIHLFCTFYPRFCASHEKNCAGAACHARDIEELCWMGTTTVTILLLLFWGLKQAGALHWGAVPHVKWSCMRWSYPCLSSITVYYPALARLS